MSSLTIKTTPVLGQRYYRYRETGSAIKHRCLLAYALAFEVELDLARVEVRELAAGTQGRRLQLTARAARATLIIHHPNLSGDEDPSNIDASQSSSERCLVSGTVIVWAPDAREARVEVGVLECADLHQDQRKFLAPLWPLTPGAGTAWACLFTPAGLAVRSALALDTGTRDEALLLPQLVQPGRDLAWRAEDRRSFKTWGFDATPSLNALASARERLSGNLPDGAEWPRAGRTAVARRWRVLDLGRDGFVPAVFRHPADDATATLGYQDAAAPDTSPHLIAELWSATELGADAQESAGAVFALLKGGIRARLEWTASRRHSVFSARQAHASFRLAASGARLEHAFLTLTSHGRPAGVKPVRVSWSPGSASAPTTDIGPTSMLFAGLAHEGESAPVAGPSEEPRWLHLDGGWLALPDMGGNAASEEMVKRLRQEAGLASASLRGAVPLGELGGPQGMSALAADAGAGVDAATQAARSVWLRLGRDGCALEVYGALLLWRTPAWWVAETRAGAAGSAETDLPDLAPAFEELAWRPNAAASSLPTELLRAIARSFRATHWIGRMGQDHALGWKLEQSGAVATLTLPAGLAARCAAFVEIGDAPLVNTRPHRGVSTASLLLDGTRALTRLGAPTAIPVLALAPRSLPRFAALPYASVEAGPAQWAATGGEMFHPHIPGLGYQPATKRFEWRHGAQMLADGWLRQRAEGGLDNTVANAPLESIRPEDDLALFSDQQASFSCHSGTVQGALSLRGWLPDRPIPVASAVVRYRASPGQPDPALSLDLQLGPADDQPVTVQISSGSQGFTMGMHSDDGRRFWLAAGDNFRNAGQPLLAASDYGWSADGLNRSWRHFRDGGRHYTGSQGSENRMNFTARALLSVPGAGPADPIAVACCETVAGQAARDWELLGGPDAPAEAGPFPLLPLELVLQADGTLHSRLRLGPPFATRAHAWTHSDGELALRWQGSQARGWSLDSDGAGAFDWTIASPCRLGAADDAPQSRIAVRRLNGKAECADGILTLTLARAGLDTPLGMLEFTTDPLPLRVEQADQGLLLVVRVEAQTDAASGFRCAFELCCSATPLAAPWFIRGTDISAPLLEWGGVDGHLTLPFRADDGIRLSNLVLHPGAARLDILLDAAQSAPDSWAFAHQQVDHRHGALAAVAGMLKVLPERPAPRLEWQFRASLALDAEALFGKLKAPGGLVRADLRVRCTGPLRQADMLHCQSTVTGRVILANDCRYGDGAAAPWEHDCELVFDMLLLDGEGALPSAIDAVALHTLARAGAAPISFQGVHRFSVKAQAGRPYLELGCILMLWGDDARTNLPATQVRLVGAPSIAMAYRTRRPDAASGYALRLPLRNLGTALLLDTRGAGAPPLHGIPWHSPLDAAPDADADPEVWHERGALAPQLAPAALAAYAGRQQAARFGGAGFPSAGATLPDWAPVLAAPGNYGAALLTGGDTAGVLAWPYHVAPDDGTVTVPSREAALAAELLAFTGAEAQAPLPSIASALLQVRDNPAHLVDWAGAETRRQSLTGAAIALVKGNPRSLRLIRRSFHAASSIDAARPAALPLAPRAPVISQLADRDDDGLPGGWQRPTRAQSEPRFTIEALASLPLVDGPEAGRLTRLASPALWLADPAPEAASGGLAIRQSLRFFSRPARQSSRPTYRVYPEATDGERGLNPVAPPIVDLTEWALRPGETMASRFWQRNATAEAGPALELSLRSPRADNGESGDELRIDPPAHAVWDGVRWALHRIRSMRTLGYPASSVESELIATVVTQRDTLIVPKGSAKPRLRLLYEVRREMPASGAAITRFRLREPLTVGVHAAAEGQKLQLELAVASGLKAGDSVAGAAIHPVERVLGDAAAWRADASRFPCVVLHAWHGHQTLPAPDALRAPESYLGGPGRQLSRLVDITQLPQSENPAQPWLLGMGEAAPRLVLLGKSQDPNKPEDRVVLLALALDWWESVARGQPERLLVTSNDRVIGFGDASGALDIALDPDAGCFVMNTVSLALESAQPGPTRLRAWRFAPSGACTRVFPAPGASTG